MDILSHNVASLPTHGIYAGSLQKSHRLTISVPLHGWKERSECQPSAAAEVFHGFCLSWIFLTIVMLLSMLYYCIPFAIRGIQNLIQKVQASFG